MSCSVKSRGRERYGKSRRERVEVCDGKTNMCEPLLTHRNRRMMDVKTGGGRNSRDKGLPVGQSSARRLTACCLGGVRCRGGVSPSRALARNRRTCRLDPAGQGFLPGRERENPERLKPRAAEYRCEAQGRTGS